MEVEHQALCSFRVPAAAARASATVKSEASVAHQAAALVIAHQAVALVIALQAVELVMVSSVVPTERRGTSAARRFLDWPARVEANWVRV